MEIESYFDISEARVKHVAGNFPGLNSLFDRIDSPEADLTPN